MKSDKILEKVRRPGFHMVNLLNNIDEATVVTRTITLAWEALYGANKRESK
jgi:hypothetical protein